MVPARVRRAGRAAADAQRQGGPPRAPRAGRRGRTASAYVAPRTAAEEVLAGICAEVLGVERVGARGRLLRAGRALAAGHARWSRASAQALGRGAAPARAVRGAHGRGRWRRAVDALGARARCRRRRRIVPRAARRARCRSRSRSSGCGSSTSWSRGAPRTTCPTRCGCGARWTRTRWSARWRRSSAGTRRCARAFPAWTASPCRWSMPRRLRARWTPIGPGARWPRTSARRAAARARRGRGGAAVRPGGGAAAARAAACGWRTTSTCCC